MAIENIIVPIVNIIFGVLIIALPGFLRWLIGGYLLVAGILALLIAL